MKLLFTDSMVNIEAGQYSEYSDLAGMTNQDIVCATAITAHGAYVWGPIGITIGIFATFIYLTNCL